MRTVCIVVLIIVILLAIAEIYTKATYNQWLLQKWAWEKEYITTPDMPIDVDKVKRYTVLPKKNCYNPKNETTIFKGKKRSLIEGE